MKAPRDLARAQSSARSFGRVAIPTVPALAGQAALRDLTDLGVWEDSVRRSRMRRDARERHLNFGPVTGKRLAVPMAMLAAGLLVRDAVSDDGSGGGTGIAHADRTAATSTASPTHHRTHPATKRAVSRHAAATTAPAATRPVSATTGSPAATAPAAAPAKRVRPAKTRVGDQLTRGDHGSAVAYLQRELGVPADGYFGPHTLRAVEGLQKRRQLAVDGAVGSATWRALRSHGPVAQAHQSADGARVHGQGVRAVQQALGLPADGVFGKNTAGAVKAFQTKHGLKADGIVGPSTWTALGVPNAQGVLREKAKRGGGHRRVASQRRLGTSVSDLQRALGIPVDGTFGSQTARAVRSFQRNHGLTADGVVGPSTWAALGVKGATKVLRRDSAHHRSGGGTGGGGGGGGGMPSAVTRAIAAADAIATAPYRYGGGHGSFQDSGYDCSGSVSYVLHGAGVLSSPLDSTALESYGAPGPGRYITIYANSGHTFMTINGRRYDTGWGGEGNRWASGSRPTGGYVVRHPPGL